MSPNSRRVNFICDKEFYEGLEAQAQKDRTSVGEIIRRALEKQYPDIPLPNPVVTIRMPGSRGKVTIPAENLPPGLIEKFLPRKNHVSRRRSSKRKAKKS